MAAEFAIRVVVKPDAAQRGARQVNRALGTIENRANRLRQTIAKTFLPVRLVVERQSLNSAGRRIKGVTDQVARLRAQTARLNQTRLTGLQRSFQRVGRSALAAGRGTSRFFRGVASRARKARIEVGGLQSVIAALSTGLLVGGIVNAGRSFQNLERRIRSVSDGAVDTARNLELIKNVSQETGTSLVENAAVFARLSIATRSLGINADRTANIVRTLNQAFVIGGSSAQEVRSAITQLGQALASGRLQGDELRSLLESAPLLAENLAKQLGITIGELRELGAAGELTSERLIFALEGAAGSIDASFKRLGPSFDQSVARLGNSLVEMGESFQPFIENLSKAIEFVAKLVGEVGDLIRLIAESGVAAREFQEQVALRSGQRFGGGVKGFVLGNIAARRRGGPSEDRTPQDEFRQQSLRLGNELQAFDPEGDLQAQVALFRSRLMETGETAGSLVKIIDDLNARNATLAERQGLAATIFGVAGTKAREAALGQKEIAAATTDLVEIQDRATESDKQRAAAASQAAVAARRGERALREQTQALQDQAQLLGLEGVEREVLIQRLKAESALRKVGKQELIDSSAARLTEIETLARENAQRREAIKLEKEASGEAEQKRLDLLSRRAQLLGQIQPKEERRAELIAEINRLQAIGILTDEERNRLLQNLPEIIGNANSQMEDFIAHLVAAEKAASQLGGAFANAIVSGVDAASNALASFVVNGARDIDSLREQLANILRDIAQDILAAIIKALILKAITAGINLGSAARTGAPANTSRSFVVNEGGPELFVPQSSPLAASVAASRARTRQSSAASRFASRQDGGSVSAAGGSNNVDAFIPGSGTLTPFSPPRAGQIVPAAQTAAILNREARSDTVVVQAPPPKVEVQSNTTIIVDGEVFKKVISTNEDVQVEILQVVRDNQDGLNRG